MSLARQLLRIRSFRPITPLRIQGRLYATSEPPARTERHDNNIKELSKSGLSDVPPASYVQTDAAPLPSSQAVIDWTKSFHGLSTEPFPPHVQDILQQPLAQDDIEVKPEGLIYLPEIKYRRILNKAFGAGGWGMAPRGETIVTAKSVTREYALVAHGRLISIARGEQDYFDQEGIPTATEGCKSNALMRCCKDLGVASELWDPRYIKKFLDQKTKDVWVEHVVSKKRKKIAVRKDDTVRYPFKEVKATG